MWDAKTHGEICDDRKINMKLAQCGKWLVIASYIIKSVFKLIRHGANWLIMGTSL